MRDPLACLRLLELASWQASTSRRLQAEFFCGFLCDKVGSLNTLSISLLINAITMLALWPASTTLAPMIVFVVLNGAANGGFFSTIPTVVGNVFGSQRVFVVMAMVVTGWGGGYLMVSCSCAYVLYQRLSQLAYKKTGFSNCWLSARCLRRDGQRISSVPACYHICRMHGTWSCWTRGVCKVSEKPQNLCKSLVSYTYIE
jgi:MFS family permease